MALFKRGTPGKPGEWYYCLKHRTVEEGPQCGALDRFGPYPSREAAAHAMETARERNEEWRTDPRWNEDEEPGTDGDAGGEGPGGGPGRDGPPGSA
ncbi:hypothetical protein [Streptomyces sp. JJ38]|uniref:hypothetical protein n=1 Tax=Streptomyces sp. JJ38 TaxID=2738128 RepID=UPI001C583ED3|nr:hypothetical protein [Streptomyces sp. JJ38]MBW1596512.1 hypothetical protein [Streptomyces sp. JJ38]